MKSILLITVMLLPTRAQAFGGLRPGTPDNFLKVVGFVIIIWVVIYFIKKL